MSDGVIPVSTDAAESTGQLQLHSAGSMLRKAREAAGLHVAALAVSMKVPVKKLEALEADRLDLLPDMVFVRALASSVCRTLKIDSAPVLEKLPNTQKPQLIAAERDINTPFDAYGSSAALSVTSVLGKPVVLVVLLLLFAAGAVFFVPALQRSEQAEEVAVVPIKPFPEVSQSVASGQSDASFPLEKAVAVPDVGQPPVGVQATEGAAPVVVQSPVANALPVALPHANAGIAVPQSAEKAMDKTVAINAVSEMLVLRAKAPCWVKVVDAKGGVQVLRVFAAGEVQGIAGDAPLSVVIGAVDAMSVEVRGKPFNLLGVAKDNVARFEVK